MFSVNGIFGVYRRYPHALLLKTKKERKEFI
jgi:hypothetical protein